MSRIASISVALLLAFTAFLPRAHAQDDEITVTAGVSDERATIGGGVMYTIIVSGSAESAEPVMGDMEGFGVEYLGPMTSTQTSVTLNNGRPRQVRSVTTTYRYFLTPTREGALKIPAATVVVDGQTHTTRAIWIEATKPAEMEDYRIKLESDVDSVYVNQPVSVRAIWYVGAEVQGFQWSVPESDEFVVVLPSSTQSTARTGSNPVPVRVGREEVYGTRDVAHIAGRAFTTVTLDLIVIPQKSGTINFGPMTIRFDRPVRSQNNIFQRTVNKREIIASNELPFDVRRPPTNAAPPGFGGLVGEYGLNASISTRDVNVGDPIELTVQITGDPYVVSGAAPDLGAAEEFIGKFKLSTDGWREEPSPSRSQRIYRTTIRAADERVNEVPAIPLHYFDADSGTYRTAYSRPLPLTVRETREITAADAIGLLSARENAPESLASKATGLPANRTGARVLRDQHPSVIGFVATPAGGLLIGGPVIAYAMVIVTTARARRRDVAGHRRRTALSRAKRELRTASRGDAPARAIRLYLADTFGHGEDSMTGLDCRRLLEDIDPDIAARFGATVDAHESGVFGTGDLHAPSLSDEVWSDLRRLDRELRKGSR